jgi:hypothetical protein
VQSGFVGTTAIARVELEPMNMVATAIKLNFFMIPQSVKKESTPPLRMSTQADFSEEDWSY